MSRAIWFVAGAGAGVYAMIRGRRAAEAFTPEGLMDRVQALGVGARIFAEELAQGRVEKEAEVREWIAERTAGPKQIGTGTPARHRLEIDSSTEPGRSAAPRGHQQSMEGSTP